MSASMNDEPSSNDFRLIEEAIRRLGATAGGTADRETLLQTLIAEVRRGRRDLFSLVRAGQRAFDRR